MPVTPQGEKISNSYIETTYILTLLFIRPWLMSSGLRAFAQSQGMFPALPENVMTRGSLAALSPASY